MPSVSSIAETEKQFSTKDHPENESYFNWLENDDFHGFEKYESDCKKFNLPPISAIKRCLEGDYPQKLNLDYFGCTPLELQLIIDTIFESGLDKVSELNLQYNNLNENLCNSVQNLMLNSQVLKALDMSHCKLGIEGAEIIADGLITSFIDYLDISHCDLTDEGGVLIVKSLEYNENLKYLNLSCNNLEGKSATAIGKMLSVNEILEDLDLSWNIFYPEKEGILPILRGLLKNVSLKSLNLAWNSLSGAKTGLFLLKSIIKSSLEQLNLEFNSLTSIEAEKITKGLKKTQHLKEINLAHNHWTDDDILNFISVFNNSPNTLKTLNLGDDKWITKEAAEMAKAIVQNDPEVKILFKGILMNNPPVPVNVKEMLLDRAKYVAMKPKRKKLRKDLG